MGLFSGMRELKTQLYFRDDNKFEFRKLPLQFSCLVEKQGDELKTAWKHFYGSQLAFPGYKNMKADMVTLGFARDIILDPFNKVRTGTETTEKPKKDATTLKNWIAKIAENQRHIYRSKRESMLLTNRITWALIGVLFIEVLVWAFRFATGGA